MIGPRSVDRRSNDQNFDILTDGLLPREAPAPNSQDISF